MTPRERRRERQRKVVANICFAIAIILTILYVAMGGDVSDR